MAIDSEQKNSSGNDNAPNSRKQAVLISFLYGYDELDHLHALDIKLDKLISKAGVGEYDWHEIAMDGSDGTLFMYGPNAEVLFKTVRPTLQEVDFMQGAVATLWFGTPGENTKMIEVEIRQTDTLYTNSNTVRQRDAAMVWAQADAWRKGRMEIKTTTTVYDYASSSI